MKKHKIPIGSILGGHIYAKHIKILILIIILFSIPSAIVIFSVPRYTSLVLIIDSIIISIILTRKLYRTTHRLTEEEKAYTYNIQWHNITPNELIFIKAYYKEKCKLYLMAFGFIILISIIFPLIYGKFNVVIIFLTIYITILTILETYILLWYGIDTSAECTYAPIFNIYSIDRHIRNGRIKTIYYAIVLIDGKKYIYQTNSISITHIMIVNYKGLSCAISSKIFP
ncbi:MAG: hypothetical protein LIO71_08245 [Ruminococcus sp.]|nr:hypothetical protein [Ruminococcus sp.]